MKISLNLVRELTGLPLVDIQEVADKINRNLGGIEEIVDLSEKYKDAKIVKVVECEKHPDADKLSVCKIDAGYDDLIQIVCGAPNVRADMWAVWLPPESVVPVTYGTNDPFKLESREIRGVVSNGMLAAGDELAINNDHDGLLVIEDQGGLVPGDSFAEKYGLNDIVIDIENKMFTHRPDCFGVLGVAREIAGIYGQKFTSPNWYLEVPKENIGSGLEFNLSDYHVDLSERFMAVAIKNIEVKPSPLWLQCELVRLGGKPINNIVDATNYIMFLTGQPTHAYDYDKLRGHSLGIRSAQKGEKIKLLNDKTYELDENDVVIVDGEGPVGLAGVMGGGESEVDKNTKNIVLECVNFNMYTIRKMSMKYGLFTDAVTRFTKGQSPLQNDRVLAKLMELVIQVGGGQQASRAYDKYSNQIDEAMDVDSLSYGINISVDFINSRLGLKLSNEDVINILKNVEIFCEIQADKLRILPPYWRTDIEIPEDIVEEVGRLYGFDKLPLELPARKMSPTPVNEIVKAKRLIRQRLKELGANEVLTYSFVHANLLKKAEQNSEEAFSLSNALSPDLQFLRLSVLPSLLDKVHSNIKTGHEEFLLYEIGKGHNKARHYDDDNGLPLELEFLDMVYSAKKQAKGSAFYKIRKLLDSLVGSFGHELIYKPADPNMDYPVTAPFDLKRSAMVTTKTGEFIGMIGELKSSVLKNFKLPEYTACATLDMDGIKKVVINPKNTYQALSRYPSTSQDICFEVDKDLSYSIIYEKLEEATNKDTGDYLVNFKPIDIYINEASENKKRVTFRLSFTNYERTATDQDINKIMDKISQDMLDAINALRV